MASTRRVKGEENSILLIIYRVEEEEEDEDLGQTLYLLVDFLNEKKNDEEEARKKKRFESDSTAHAGCITEGETTDLLTHTCFLLYYQTEVYTFHRTL